MDAVAWLTPSSFSMMNLSASVTSENGRDSPAVIWPSRDTWLNHSTLAGWLKSKPVRSMTYIPYLTGIDERQSVHRVGGKVVETNPAELEILTRSARHD